MFPLTVQMEGVFVENTTGSPELAVAFNVSGESKMNFVPIVGKEMVCVANEILKLCVTLLAALKLLLPA
jgi:hypothetical protein